jgi:hypothetical protein
LHLVMNPVSAKADLELREIDDKSREDILQGEELTSYLSKYERWLRNYNSWINSFPDAGIELRPWKEDSPRNDDAPGIRYVDVENERPLPPPFRSRKVPLHVQRMTREFNTALRTRGLTNLERKVVYDKYLPLIRATYQEELNKLREDFFYRNFPDRFQPNNPAAPGPEMISILQCVENLTVKSIWERLRHVASTSRRTGHSIEIYEQLRGELRIREKLVTAPPVSEADDDAAEVKHSDSRISDIVIPGYEKAIEEYVPVAEKVINGQVISESERGDIVRYILPRSDKDQLADVEETTKLVLKVSDGAKLTLSEQTIAAELMLRRLWQHFAKVSAESLERACPELKHPNPVDSLLDQIVTPATVQRLPPLGPAPTEAEVREVGTEINNLLQKFRDGTISGEEHLVLDYLLRPMVNDRLRELDREIGRLCVPPKSADNSKLQSYQANNLNPRQSLHLVELQTQWAREFEKWKINLPAYGVIIDEWFSEADVIPNIIKRYGEVREILNRPQEHNLQEKGSQEIFPILKRYITDSTFNDDDGKLLLERLPAAIAAQRDALFHRREILDARNRNLSLSESLSLSLLEHAFVSEYMAWYNAVPVGIPVLGLRGVEWLTVIKSSKKSWHLNKHKG